MSFWKKGMGKERQERVGSSDSFGKQNALCGFSENNDSPNGNTLGKFTLNSLGSLPFHPLSLLLPSHSSLYCCIVFSPPMRNITRLQKAHRVTRIAFALHTDIQVGVIHLQIPSVNLDLFNMSCFP